MYIYMTNNKNRMFFLYLYLFVFSDIKRYAMEKYLQNLRDIFIRDHIFCIFRIVSASSHLIDFFQTQLIILCARLDETTLRYREILHGVSISRLIAQPPAVESK